MNLLYDSRNLCYYWYFSIGIAIHNLVKVLVDCKLLVANYFFESFHVLDKLGTNLWYLNTSYFWLAQDFNLDYGNLGNERDWSSLISKPTDNPRIDLTIVPAKSVL